jgi:hypothetical protein
MQTILPNSLLPLTQTASQILQRTLLRLTRELTLQRLTNELDETVRTRAERGIKEAAERAALGDVTLSSIGWQV